ncbi:GAF and ANTAR domain-containing protein [Amycolatopsis sp. NPDC023774]|uniref:GAF and ANTAR domain-containing protein n=1 Tax=Amycolatopsis sp. NPDC023774 TaxID=3155015 RepID=UPI0033CDF396
MSTWESADLEAGREDGNGALAQKLASLTRLLLDATTVGEALERVVEAAPVVIPGADLVSITLRAPDGELNTPVRTEPVARELDQVQYDADEGPCVDIARHVKPGYALSHDLGREPRWQTFAPAAAERGYSSVLSTALVPSSADDGVSGALNVYSNRTHAFAEESRDAALLLATHASLALARTSALARAELDRLNLERAIESRDVIGQAKGILMSRRGITADEAFDLLRRTSQDVNVKLAELARTLAQRHTELDVPPHA